MVPLTPLLLVASAGSFVGINQSPANYLASLFRTAPLGADQEMWSLHFLNHVGSRSHLDPRSRISTWPLPPTRFVNELVSLAAKQNVVRTDTALPGDVFALWSREKQRFVQVGIIVRADCQPPRALDGDASCNCETIECIAREEEGAVTRSVLLRDRKLSPAAGDRFIRWSDMAPATVRFVEAA